MNLLLIAFQCHISFLFAKLVLKQKLVRIKNYNFPLTIASLTLDTFVKIADHGQKPMNLVWLEVQMSWRRVTPVRTYSPLLLGANLRGNHSTIRFTLPFDSFTLSESTIFSWVVVFEVIRRIFVAKKKKEKKFDCFDSLYIEMKQIFLYLGAILIDSCYLDQMLVTWSTSWSGIIGDTSDSNSCLGLNSLHFGLHSVTQILVEIYLSKDSTIGHTLNSDMKSEFLFEQSYRTSQ